MSTMVKKILPGDRRALVVSDIHGNLPYLEGLLKKTGFSPERDLLIVDGDFLEKGKQSLDTLRYLMRLVENGCCWVVRGNCDGWHQILSGGMDKFIMKYMLTRPDCVLRQMCREQGLDVMEDTPLGEIKSVLTAHHAAEMDFLASLPIAIDTEEYTFVHGGISRPDMLRKEPWRCMKNDNFLGQGLSFDKWQIVGHWPVVLYRENITDANPIILRDRHIASIDGGCVLKDDGQLNALIIPPGGGDDFECAYYDPFPTARALTAQSASEKSYYIRWGDNAVEPLAFDGEFTRCRHLRTGYEMDIPSDYVRMSKRGFTVNDCTDYRLPVEPGDLLSVVKRTSRGCLCKKNGVSGWYSGKLEPVGD